MNSFLDNLGNSYFSFDMERGLKTMNTIHLSEKQKDNIVEIWVELIK